VETPPKWQSWTVSEVCFAAFAVGLACLAAYVAARMGFQTWGTFVAFAVTLGLLLAVITHGQSKRFERHEEDYSAWLERRVGGPPKKKGR
jgi:Flp pilus assembly protein TadB